MFSDNKVLMTDFAPKCFTTFVCNLGTYIINETTIIITIFLTFDKFYP